MTLEHFSVWRGAGSRPLPEGFAATVEQLGFRRLWLGGVPAELANVELALEETSTLELASGIVNIWTADARTAAESYHRLEQRFPGRFLLGIGTGHPESVEQYTKPYESIVKYLDVLDAEGVPEDRRVLAALGPRVLKLAADRSAGAHPYLVPPSHTKPAREALGPDKLLFPEHKVVLETDPEKARALARPRVEKPYLHLVNYRSNLLRLGFTEADLENSGSDQLIDAVVAHGTADEIAEQLGAHLEAGADEVPVQVLTASFSDDVTPQLTELADALHRFEAAH